ncbi:MAG TPA: hypothetical protein VFL04_08420, partial [Rectinemataceae bacterium]|nr:hypothetical protein [Rectinemataceae bacterium]
LNGAACLLDLLSGLAPTEPPFRLLDPSYYLERIPVRISPMEIGLVAAACLLLCLLASLLPARRAARLPPMEIMRRT